MKEDLITDLAIMLQPHTDMNMQDLKMRMEKIKKEPCSRRLQWVVNH